MTKPLLIKKSFNGGELSPELHYRDDLAAYAKGCKYLDNMQATPYGAVTRRPPMELMARIDTDLYGVPVKYIPFKFSLDEVFNIVFTDGSGSESADPTTADVVIYDSNGNLVILGGTTSELTVIPAVLPAILASGFTALANTIYDTADLGDLHFINVNDYVYLTCGGNYPVQRINRFFDDAANANRWRIDPAPIDGLMEDGNLDTTSAIYVHAREWDSVTTYEQGVTVTAESDSDAITGISWQTVKQTSTFVYSIGMRVSVADSSLYAVGDQVRIDGVTVATLPNDVWYDKKKTSKVSVGDSLDGAFDVVEIVNATTIRVNQLLYRPFGGSAPVCAFAGASLFPTAIGGGFPFYRSLQDSNLNNDLSDSNWWVGSRTHQGEVLIEAREGTFVETDVGREFAMETESKIGDEWTTQVNVSEAVVAQGVFELTTEGGAWNGDLNLQESIDGGETWQTIKTITSIYATNGSVEVTISNINTLLRVQIDNLVMPSGTFAKEACVWTLTAKNRVFNYFIITEYIDSGNVVASTKTTMLTSLTDYRWALGVFSETTGYPFSLTVHDERMTYAGCRKSPNTIYASRVNDWGNFLEGTSDVAPYTFTIASDSFDTARSIKSSRQLNIFTDNQEVTMGSREDSAVTSVTNIAVSSHTNYGSNNVQAVQMADMIWFSMGQGRRVRASRYDFASDGQQSIEMSLFANHITESGIKEMSFRRHPFNTLFCVLNNGTACSFTYEGAQDVQAWSPITTDGNIISAYANYSDKGDIVNGIVEREGFYYLERFGSNDESTIYLDNFVTYVDKDFTLGVTLEQGFTDNLVVVDCQDRQLVEGVDYTIIGGVLTIPEATCNTVTVGIPFTSRVNPTDVTEYAPDGALRRLSALALYLLDSGDCEVKINGKDSNFTAGSRLLPTERLDGRHEMTTGGGYDSGCDVDIYVRDHKPFTLIGLGYRMSANQ